MKKTLLLSTCLYFSVMSQMCHSAKPAADLVGETSSLSSQAIAIAMTQDMIRTTQRKFTAAHKTSSAEKDLEAVSRELLQDQKVLELLEREAASASASPPAQNRVTHVTVNYILDAPTSGTNGAHSYETIYTAKYEQTRVQEIQNKKMNKLLPEDLVFLLNYEFERNKSLKELSAEGKDIVIFLGNTGVGKSTTINWLAGKELKQDGDGYKLKDSSDATALPIGSNGDSTTLYPGCIEVNGTLYFDLPGFVDTEGSVRELVNAAFIHKIIKEAKTVRPIFVLTSAAFKEKARRAIEFFDKVSSMFVNNPISKQGFYDSSLLLVTDERSADAQSLWGKLNEATSSNKGNEKANALNTLLETWHSGQRIGKMPSPDKPVTFDSDRNAVNTIISTLSPYRHKDIDIAAMYSMQAQDGHRQVKLDGE